jgi:hypothetical protein
MAGDFQGHERCWQRVLQVRGGRFDEIFLFGLLANSNGLT